MQVGISTNMGWVVKLAKFSKITQKRAMAIGTNSVPPPDLIPILVKFNDILLFYGPFKIFSFLLYLY